MTGKVIVMDHPLITHKINYVRQENVGTKEFREVIGEIAQLMCYEATRDLKMSDVQIKTPLMEMTGKMLSGKKLAIVPILRAGIGMVDGMLSLIPAAKVGHIGLYRDPETLEPVEYYCKLPADCEEREVFVVDPMLATGGSSVAAIRMLKEKGVKHIRFLCILAAPEGVKKMQEAHPDVDIYIGALDEKLISYRDLAMPEIVFSEQNKKLTENRTEMKGAELMSGKRTDYLTWDEYFMGVAMLSGMRSKDPNTQVGCCIVSQDNKILSMGYNGFPLGCSDDEFPWVRDGEDPLETKYVYSTHSELNAILNYSGGSLAGAKLYVSLFPCNECAKAIIQAGIKEVIYDCDKYADTPSVIASKRMMDAAGVRYHQYHRTNRKIEIEL